MRRAVAVFLAVLTATPGWAADGFRFASSDGGSICLDDGRGKPVPVANTASLCGFAAQVDALQTLHDRFGGRALVPAVPPDDFNQELADVAVVREYCALTFDLNLPMTEMTHVKGAAAHPFYPGLRAETGSVPGWTFDRVLIAPDGSSAGIFGAPVRPEGPRIAGRIAAMPE